MELVKLIDGKPVPYTEAAFRADNKHTVYGSVVSSRHLNAQDVYRVTVKPKPVELGKVAVQDALPALVEGVWTLGWTLRSVTEHEARTLRNELISKTDWWATSDRTMSQAEADYRQALRDIPQQAGFPDNITWPQEPSA